MKKNWLALVSILLNVVLVVLVVRLNTSLAETKRQLTDRIDWMEQQVERIPGDIYQLTKEALKTAAKQVADYEVQPTGIDAEKRVLTADVVLTLKEWQADTRVTLEADVGGRQTEAEIPVENGICRGSIEIPVNQSCEVFLNASITSGGATVREELGGWSDVSMLLPIRVDGSGGSVPYYENGSVVVGSYTAYLCDPKGQPVENIGARYRLYVNDELVIEDEQCHNWTYPCEPDAVYHLTLACEDAFGLGYEFTLLRGICDENESENASSSMVGNHSDLVLTWN